MAVLVEGCSVVMRTSSIGVSYPGGIEGYRRDCPNDSFCTDGELVRVGFDSPQELGHWVERLFAYGFCYLSDGACADFALVDHVFGLALPCPWLDLLRLQRPTMVIRVGRLRNSMVSEVAFPAGWSYRGSLSRRCTYIATDAPWNRMDYVGSSDGYDVFQCHDAVAQIMIGAGGAR